MTFDRRRQGESGNESSPTSTSGARAPGKSVTTQYLQRRAAVTTPAPLTDGQRAETSARDRQLLAAVDDAFSPSRPVQSMAGASADHQRAGRDPGHRRPGRPRGRHHPAAP